MDPSHRRSRPHPRVHLRPQPRRGRAGPLAGGLCGRGGQRWLRRLRPSGPGQAALLGAPPAHRPQAAGGLSRRRGAARVGRRPQDALWARLCRRPAGRPDRPAAGRRRPRRGAPDAPVDTLLSHPGRASGPRPGHLAAYPRGRTLHLRAHPRRGGHQQSGRARLPPFVIARKISGGSRSPLGSAIRCDLASVFLTWTARRLNPLSACLAALQAPLPQL